MRMRYSSSLLTTLAFMLLFAEAAATQINPATAPPGEDSGDLYQRVASSRFVVIGTVVKSEGVGRRLSESEQQKIIKPAPEGERAIVLLPVLGGSLYTIRIEKTLCREEEFRIKPVGDGEAPANSEQTDYMFVPRTKPEFAGGYPQETLQSGDRYLLFLYQPDPEKQHDWTTSFDLDPNRVYFRGEELSRGVIPLAKSTAENPQPAQPPVLEKVTLLCEALRPTGLADKLAGLKNLEESGDPILAKEAKAATNALAKQATHTSPNR